MQTIGLAILLIIALDIWAGISVVQSTRSTMAKVSWLAVIIVLPVVGFLAWLIAGPRPGAGSG